MQPLTEMLLILVLSGMIGSYVGHLIGMIIDIITHWKEGKKKS